MIKNKRYLPVALLVLTIFMVSACGNRSGASTGGAPRTPFIGGTSAIIMDFERDSPPPEVTDDQSFAFNVIVRLQNQGESTVERQDMKLNLVGFDPSDFGLTFDDLREIEPEDDLQRKQRDAEGNLIDGTTTFATFPRVGGEFVPDQFPGNTEFTFRADVCYKYETDANTKLCGLRDMINIRQNAICLPNGGKTIYSSSAPVQIAGFRQSVVGKDKISFSFDVIRSGNVDIFWNKNFDVTPSSGFEQSCPRDPRQRREVESNVLVEIREIPNDPVFTDLKCGGLDNSHIGVVKLVNGRRTITCTAELVADRSDFEKAVSIHATYNVLDSRETKVLIKHLAEAP